MSQPFVVQPPAPAGAAPTRPVLAKLLHERLHGSSEPVVMGGGTTVPGASVWTAARGLVRQLRECGLEPADRVLLRTDDRVLTAVGVVAAVTGRFSLALMAPGHHDDLLMTAADARLVLGGRADTARPAGPPHHVTTAGLDGLDGLDGPGGVVLRRSGRPTDGESALLVADRVAAPARWTTLGLGPLADAVRARLDERHGQAALADGRRPAGVLHLTDDLTTADGAVDLLVGLLTAEVLLLDAAPAVADVTDVTGRSVGAAGGAR